MRERVSALTSSLEYSEREVFNSYPPKADISELSRGNLLLKTQKEGFGEHFDFVQCPSKLS